ncbi:hypothetical protein [Ensifer canadensis]
MAKGNMQPTVVQPTKFPAGRRSKVHLARSIDESSRYVMRSQTNKRKVLDPDVAFRADNESMRQGSVPEIRGAMAVAEAFKGRARSALPVLVDRGFGLVIAPDERQRIVLRLSCKNERITAIWAISKTGKPQPRTRRLHPGHYSQGAAHGLTALPLPACAAGWTWRLEIREPSTHVWIAEIGMQMPKRAVIVFNLDLALILDRDGMQP